MCTQHGLANLSNLHLSWIIKNIHSDRQISSRPSFQIAFQKITIVVYEFFLVSINNSLKSGEKREKRVIKAEDDDWSHRWRSPRWAWQHSFLENKLCKVVSADRMFSAHPIGRRRKDMFQWALSTYTHLPPPFIAFSLNINEEFVQPCENKILVLPPLRPSVFYFSMNLIKSKLL